MRHIALFSALWLTLSIPARSGGVTCSATCLSKIASVVSVAANAKTIVAGAKKVRHPNLKAAKATSAH